MGCVQNQEAINGVGIMSELKNEACEACSKDSPLATEEEKRTLGADVPEWRMVTRNGEEQLERTFKLKNFAQALAFTNQVGEIAEEADHHPMIVTEYGKVTVVWWTHKIGGLHRNDFVMAAKTDDLYNQQ